MSLNSPPFNSSQKDNNLNVFPKVEENHPFNSPLNNNLTGNQTINQSGQQGDQNTFNISQNNNSLGNQTYNQFIQQANQNNSFNNNNSLNSQVPSNFRAFNKLIPTWNTQKETDFDKYIKINIILIVILVILLIILVIIYCLGKKWNQVGYKDFSNEEDTQTTVYIK
jgi:predicted RND superfamily exporter protein